MSTKPVSHHPLLRHRDGHHARVTYEELFFDLVYVFAVTQLSHGLLNNLTPSGVVETLILWFAVWLGWQYTCWVTNWFDPQTPRIRGLIFATMLFGLVMAASIPQAFSDRGLVFAGAYVAMQVGRTAFIALQLAADQPLAPNYRRMLGWVSIAAVFWVAGGLMHHETRALFWLVAVMCEYVSPMFGFALPGLGRSRTQEWTIEGGHLAERCQLFVIVALGETLLASGATLATAAVWTPAVLLALLGTFVGTLAMWWLYFGTSSKDATRPSRVRPTRAASAPTSTTFTPSWSQASLPPRWETIWYWPTLALTRPQHRSPSCWPDQRSICWAAPSTSGWSMALCRDRTWPAC